MQKLHQNTHCDSYIKKNTNNLKQYDTEKPEKIILTTKTVTSSMIIDISITMIMINKHPDETCLFFYSLHLIYNIQIIESIIKPILRKHY